jgi:hypothetical protein
LGSYRTAITTTCRTGTGKRFGGEDEDEDEDEGVACM